MEALMYQLLNDYCDYCVEIQSSQFWLELTNQPNVFYAYFQGEKGSIHEGALYKANITVPIEYPKQRPNVIFTDPLPYHCNIGKDGKLCLDYWNEWKSSCTLNYLLEQISNLLHNQNNKSCLRGDIGAEEKNEFGKYVQNVKLQGAKCKNAYSQ